MTLNVSEFNAVSAIHGRCQLGGMAKDCGLIRMVSLLRQSPGGLDTSLIEDPSYSVNVIH